MPGVVHDDCRCDMCLWRKDTIGLLDRIEALERELESARQVSMLKDDDRLRLQAERDEAHAAIRKLRRVVDAAKRYCALTQFATVEDLRTYDKTAVSQTAKEMRDALADL